MNYKREGTPLPLLIRGEQMMNKTALKNFATQSRRKLIEQVQTKALLYGIDENNGLHIEEQFGQLLINGQTYPLSIKSAFTALQKQLEQKGYKQLLEEVAYTWFNRIIAIRYMEVHEYLPERVNVLSSSVGRVDPDILFEYDTMDLAIKTEEICELTNGGNMEGAYRILFVAQCNALNRILPFMFEPIQDYTELLLPEFLLDAESVIKTLVQNDELTDSFAEIEVIGWLYQYYIAEEKDRVFAQKSKYKKEEIPFATQLFTPKWIVQYMVQNSLGRYWTEAHREDEDLIHNWEYFIKHEEEDFHDKITPYVNKELKVEDIKLIDPAMGSGHILVYAFEVFYEIYEKCGYPEREIPRLILENNLYGLDIDDRAYQLAAFAIVMKATQYSRRFLRGVEREGIQLNIASIQETNPISDDVIAYIAQQEVGEQYNQVKAFFDQYYNAKTYGSLINITIQDMTFIEERLKHIQNNPVNDLFYGEQHEIAKQLLPALILQTKIVQDEYDVVVMNPPYMGSGNMSKELGDFLKKNYPDSKSDLFAAFMEVDPYIKKNGFYAAINQHSWMFLSSFEKLRKKLINTKFIDTMLHLGPRAFEEIGGEVVQSTTFVLRNTPLENSKGIYLRLIDGRTASEKKHRTFEAVQNPSVSYRYSFDQGNCKKVSGSSIIYWVNEVMMNLLSSEHTIGNSYEVGSGLSTSDNERFLRYHWEVSKNKIGKGLDSIDGKWFLFQKGGEFRRWYGNLLHVVNWENQGEEIKHWVTHNPKDPNTTHWSRRIFNTHLYFRRGITWSVISSGKISFRLTESNSMISNAAGGIFGDFSDKEYYNLLAALNSKLWGTIFNIINPTLNYSSGIIQKAPLPDITKLEFDDECIKISRDDWNSFETSWDFAKHPFLRESTTKVANAFERWENFTQSQFNKLKANEEELNRIFIEFYGLQGEFTPDVEDKDITVRKADLGRDVRSFLSYFIGCMVGRYSLDVECLAYAGGEWNGSMFSSFQPSKNGVVHFTDSSYFENDIISRLREFLAVTFAADTVGENLQWIAEALEMKNGEDAESRIRRYFQDDFFADHCKMYQKRPIYWLVDSGKQKGLRTLIYMHRYQPDTMATIRFEHLQEIQAKYQQEIADLENRLVNPNLSAMDKKRLTAEKVDFEKKIEELHEFDKHLAAIASEEMKIDLDDGVKVNYEKFYRGGKGVLAKIK